MFAAITVGLTWLAYCLDYLRIWYASGQAMVIEKPGDIP